MKQWFLATTGREFVAADELRKQGYSIYLPRAYWKVAGAVASALRYPGYIFVWFDPSIGEAGPVNNTRGIDELMVNGDGRPRNLPGIRVKDQAGYVIRVVDLVEAIREMEDKEFSDAASTLRMSRTDLRVGEWVKIDNDRHPANGNEGEILKIQKKVVHVLIGLSMIWEVPELDVKKATRPGRKAA